MSRQNQRRIRDEVRRQQLAVRRKRLTMAALATLTIAAAGGGLWSLNRTLGISQWQIAADAGLKQQIDAALAGMANLDFWHSQPAALSDALRQQLPDIAEIRIQRRLPDTLIIQARTRTPVALWQQQDGALWLVDGSGEAYRPMRRDEAFSLPIMRMSQKQLAAACSLLARLAETNPSRLAALSELVAEEEGWKLNLTHSQQWRLPFGKAAMWQMARLETLLQQPRWRAGFWRVNTRLGGRWFLRPADQQGVI